MVVLGISPNHDSVLCIVKDGKILSAISRERISRVKKDRYITQKMMDYVLDHAGMTIDDIDYVGITYWFENRTTWKNEFEDFVTTSFGTHISSENLLVTSLSVTVRFENIVSYLLER